MDKFTKVRNIGKGNMGACALARNNEDGKYYVIKQVDLTRMNKKERQQSLNEARVLSSLRHPNIINYVDSFLAKKSDHLCIVMEFADGGDLSSRIKKNYGVNFRESQVLDWFIQLVLSLHYVHQRKILHRDVKTQNVFITSDNVVKLGDFGIARTLSNTYDQAKTFVGTPYYLSPELILERPYDHRSDVWAVGVVLYELLTLKHPFNATDMKGLMQRILKVQYDPIPMMYSTEMRNIVPRLLMKDPAQRIRLDEILELPIVRRRLVEWMKGDMVPTRYLEALLKQRLLPESALTEADEEARTKERSHASSGAGSPRSASHSTRGGEASNSQGEAPRATASSYSSPAPPPPQQQLQEQQSSRLPVMRRSSEAAVSSSGPVMHGHPSMRQVSQQRSIHENGAPPKTSYPSQSRASGNPSSALYKFYRAPAPQQRAPRVSLQQQRSAVPSSSRSNPVPARLSNLDNFYQQLNYYQQGGGAEGRAGHHSGGYPSTSGAGSGKYPSGHAPMSARHIPSGNRARSESGQAAAYLNPLFRPSNGANAPSSSRAYDAGNPHMDIKAMLQRAAMERAQRRLGGAT